MKVVLIWELISYNIVQKDTHIQILNNIRNVIIFGPFGCNEFNRIWRISACKRFLLHGMYMKHIRLENTRKWLNYLKTLHRHIHISQQPCQCNSQSRMAPHHTHIEDCTSVRVALCFSYICHPCRDWGDLFSNIIIIYHVVKL